MVESLPMLAIAPARVYRGTTLKATLISVLPSMLSPCSAQHGVKILVIAGRTAKAVISPAIDAAAEHCQGCHVTYSEVVGGCTEANLGQLLGLLGDLAATGKQRLVIAAGGGKVLDLGKLVAHRAGVPMITIPTTAATCAAWTALSNVYTDAGAFAYDVPLPSCPEIMVVDYSIIATAPRRTLVAGIGDAIAKWYEASVSSGSSQQTMVIAAVQEARILRDILLQKSRAALTQYEDAVDGVYLPEWREVVDANVCLAGVIGGIGGASCRTVAAHGIHNALTHLPEAYGTLHGEKVAYGILVQLRLEEMQGNQLAATARQQLLRFYQELGLPQTLGDLGLGDVSLRRLEQVAETACHESSDIHRLPFVVTPTQVLAAMVSTTLVNSNSAAMI
jgi:glycerol dehydrogenase